MEFVTVVAILGLVAIVAIVCRTKFVAAVNNDRVELKVDPTEKE